MEGMSEEGFTRIYDLLSACFEKIEKRSGEVPPVIYHYTTIEGLVGIISGSSLWLSDVMYLNDKDEFLHGFRVLESEFYKIKKAKSQSLHQANVFIESMMVACRQRARVYSCSFCEGGDILSQWRGYANGGVSIGFKSDYFLNADNDFSVHRVIYKDELKSDLAWDFFVSLQNSVSMYIDSGKRIYDDVYFMKSVCDILLTFSCILKSQWFSEENESRLMISDIIPRDDISHRVSDGVIIPYLSQKIEISEAVCEIIIGPNSRSEILLRGIKSFIDSAKLSNLKVRNSSIPYRKH